MPLVTSSILIQVVEVLGFGTPVTFYWPWNDVRYEWLLHLALHIQPILTLVATGMTSLVHA